MHRCQEMKEQSREFIENKIEELDGLHEKIENWKNLIRSQNENQCTKLDEFDNYICNLRDYDEVIQTYGT